MRRGVAAILTVVAAVIAPALASTAGAATDDPDDLAKRYGVLQERDLPTGYTIDSVRRETGAIAGYFEVQGDCARINTAVKFFDGDPTVDDDVVTYLVIYDDAVTDAEFAALLKQAVRRSD